MVVAVVELALQEEVGPQYILLQVAGGAGVTTCITGSSVSYAGGGGGILTGSPGGAGGCGGGGARFKSRS